MHILKMYMHDNTMKLTNNDSNIKKEKQKVKTKNNKY